MYTQCPECHIAFRITATVLRQAGGRVKCGGCGNAFSALEYISEDPPDTLEESNGDVTAQPADAVVDDVAQSDGETNHEEQNSELLKALDDLAGPEQVRIEDTGVEWRVLAEGEDLDPVGEDVQNQAAGRTADWYIDDGEDDESDRAEEIVDAEESNDPEIEEKAPIEARYDDSTPLPDDYGDDANEAAPSVSTSPDENASPEAEELPVLEDAQVDLEAGEPDEWLDLLDEVLDQQAGHSNADSESGQSDTADAHDDTSSAAIRLEAGEELAAIHSELSLPLEADFEPPDDVTEENEAINAGDAPVEADATEDAEPVQDEEPDAVDEQPEIEIETAANDDTIEGEEVFVEDDESATEEDFEAEDEPAEPEDEVEDDLAEDATSEADDEEADDPLELELAIEDEDRDRDRDEDEAEDEDEDEDDAIDAEDDEFGKQIALIESSLATERDDEEDAQQDSNEDDEVKAKLDDDEVAEHDIEKELQGSSQYEPADDESQHTVNVQIHEDMRRAMDDEQFAATMTSEDGSPLIETIIMEGEFVRGSIKLEEADPDSEQSTDLEEHKSLLDTYVLNRSKGNSMKFLTGSRASMMASVVILVLVLAGQYVHTSREFLATYGMFNQTIGPVYRVLGSPVIPAWDIKGWQFETTNGSTDEGEQLLTIFSRISNRSDQALPYPLVYVSLTDRWEEIIGSRVLEPNEYLAGNPDPRRPVAAGDKFTAVISIASPAAEVTGFKMNVCYRLSPGRLSCAIDDFKN